jgi:hypothetical protein
MNAEELIFSELAGCFVVFSLPTVQECYVSVGMKWLFKNSRPRAAYALRNPGYAFSTLYRELCFSDERFLARICGVSPLRIRGFLDEPGNTPEFAQHIGNAVKEFRALHIENAPRPSNLVAR